MMRKEIRIYVLVLAVLTVGALVMTAKGALLASPAEPGDRISLRQESMQTTSRRAHFFGGHVRGK